MARQHDRPGRHPQGDRRHRAWLPASRPGTLRTDIPLPAGAWRRDRRRALVVGIGTACRRRCFQRRAAGGRGGHRGLPADSHEQSRRSGGGRPARRLAGARRRYRRRGGGALQCARRRQRGHPGRHRSRDQSLLLRGECRVHRGVAGRPRPPLGGRGAALEPASSAPRAATPVRSARRSRAPGWTWWPSVASCSRPPASGRRRSKPAPSAPTVPAMRSPVIADASAWARRSVSSTPGSRASRDRVSVLSGNPG